MEREEPQMRAFGRTMSESVDLATILPAEWPGEKRLVLLEEMIRSVRKKIADWFSLSELGQALKGVNYFKGGEASIPSFPGSEEEGDIERWKELLDWLHSRRQRLEEAVTLARRMRLAIFCQARYGRVEAESGSSLTTGNSSDASRRYGLGRDFGVELSWAGPDEGPYQAGPLSEIFRSEREYARQLKEKNLLLLMKLRRYLRQTSKYYQVLLNTA